MKNQIAPKNMTSGQVKDFISALVQEVPINLPYNSKGKILKEVRKLFISMTGNFYDDAVLSWEQFYLKYFQKTYDFSQILIPDCPGEKWYLLIIVDLLLEQLYTKCKELFQCWRWTNDNLDKIVVKNERDAKNGHYAIWVKDEVEADEKYKNLSANQIKEMGIKTETLAERFTHELKVFDKTGNHLDIKNITLCAGSRYSDGNVPSVCCFSDYGELSVDWCHPGGAYGILRVREVSFLN